MANISFFSTSSTSSSSNGLLDYLLTDYWALEGDPRTGHLPLMSSATPLLLLLSAYSLFVLKLGPRWMARRKAAFSLKPLLIVYNLLLSLWNAHFFLSFLALHHWGSDLFNVERPSFAVTSKEVLSQIHLQHVYFLSKLVDLLETVFFVLRKKQSQVTGLHFYHHLSVPIVGWIHIRLVGNGITLVLFGILNSFVHTIMYAYYGLSALGPKMTPYLWWKRYITQVQIVQFLLFLSYSAYFAVAQRGYKTIFTLNIVSQSALYIYLFSRFYFSTYGRRNESSRQKRELKEEVEEEMVVVKEGEETPTKSVVEANGGTGEGGDKAKEE